MTTDDSPQPRADNAGTCDLVPLPQFGSLSETEVVVALLQSCGIPVVEGGRYNPKAPTQVLVPRNRLADAHRLIANARGHSSSATPLHRPSAEERPSVVTAITWVLAIGMVMCVLVIVGKLIYGLAAHWFR
jgi:hypothetical protein